MLLTANRLWHRNTGIFAGAVDGKIEINPPGGDETPVELFFWASIKDVPAKMGSDAGIFEAAMLHREKIENVGALW